MLFLLHHPMPPHSKASFLCSIKSNQQLPRPPYPVSFTSERTNIAKFLLEVTAAIAGALAPSPSDIYNAAAALIASGITPGNLTQLVGILVSGCNSQNNKNPAPQTAIYPRKGASDAPYDVLESKLRAAIQIPSTFTYGQKPPVILAPGTGSTGCFSFTGNFIKLLTGKSYADPVWLNIPDYLLDDVQTNAVRPILLL